MDIQATLEAQLAHTLQETNFDGLGTLYRGKVRDVYRSDQRLVIVTSDRVSAFDHVLGTIPFKGQILTQIAVEAFKATEDILPNHVLDVPDPNVIVGKSCRAYPVEFIVRGYITGSLWRDYEAGRAGAYGVPLPEGLKKDQAFEAPILTPTTKAEIGTHDQPISRTEIIAKGLMTESEFDAAHTAALALYERGRSQAAQHGLILVDTKYELGLDEAGKLTVIDEIHTPDSSRYWIEAEYASRFAEGQAQAMLDKENLRGWLIDTHGFSGHGEPPALDNDIRTTLARRYMELYAHLVGHPFEPHVGNVVDRIDAALKKAGLFTS